MSKMSTVYQQQSIGIDVSKKDLHCRHGLMSVDREIEMKSSKVVDNTLSGFKQLHRWLKQLIKRYEDISLTIVLEATGVYHQGLVYFLAKQGYKVCISFPKAAKHYARSLAKTKNDQIDASILARMGLERKLSPWKAPSEELMILKSLIRELTQLKRERTRIKNQQEAQSHTYLAHKDILKRMRKRVEFLDKQIEQIQKQILKQAEASQQIKEALGRIEKVKGLGKLTILTIIAETNGFALFSSIKQLCSYAGLDVVENQSGKKQGRTRISKVGNTQIRSALYMPAVSSIRANPTLRAFYLRLLEKGKEKKQALIAVARKLLVIIYSLWKSGQEYQENFSRNMSTT